MHTVQDSKSALSAFILFVSEPASESAQFSVSEQFQLSVSKQSLLIMTESAILIQSLSSYHAFYDHKSFHFYSLNQHLHHDNQYWLSYYDINKSFQMYDDDQNAIYDFR